MYIGYVTTKKLFVYNKKMWLVFVAIVLIMYICVMVFYTLPSSTRTILKSCKKGSVCHLTDAFPLKRIPWVPVVLFNYYDKKDYTPEVKQEMDLRAKQLGISYKIVNRRTDWALGRPKGEPLPVSVLV